jgi:hypothetical protein
MNKCKVLSINGNCITAADFKNKRVYTFISINENKDLGENIDIFLDVKGLLNGTTVIKAIQRKIGNIDSEWKHYFLGPTIWLTNDPNDKTKFVRQEDIINDVSIGSKWANKENKSKIIEIVKMTGNDMDDIIMVKLLDTNNNFIARSMKIDSLLRSYTKC